MHPNCVSILSASLFICVLEILPPRQVMHQLWIGLCLMWKGANAFMIYNTVEGLCIDDSHSDAIVQLKQCHLDSEYQNWAWEEGGVLANEATQRCLSALHTSPMRTVICDGADHIQWQCTNHQLVSLNRSLELTADSGRLTLDKGSKENKWKSLDGGDICQLKPSMPHTGPRRQSEPGEQAESDAKGFHTQQSMTNEEKEFLRWLYRTEDSTSWTFAMLVLSFIALLLGSVLVVMSMMGNRNRQKIDKYRTAAATAVKLKSEFEELQVTMEAKDSSNPFPAPMQHSQPHRGIPVGGASEAEALKPGDIMVTWKDGSVSNLYSNSQEEDGEK
ncbi:uncharacterized protein LOC143528936 isoform X2 [Brachyhypopomus gauderio]|uniref:uncharacterized protein LOC143528936 isoform X2 n=1 Tax=Brachyhypopomus gauderio TaxID=698409 RepID=UPI004040EE1C